MDIPHLQQVQDQQSAVAALLADHVTKGAWLPPFVGPESGYRNKAKLAVAGERSRPTFGILDPRTGLGTDLRDCGLYEPTLAASLGPLTDALTEVGLVPYDVPGRTGELKHLLVTASPDAELMARVVLRSDAQLSRLRRHLPDLLAAVPGLRVVSANLQPAHAAILEGPEEVVLTAETTLPMRLAGLTLHLGPRSFFQTCTPVAAALYQQAREWVAEVGPDRVLDLYCGVGGFALAAATAARTGPPPDVAGIEVSADAVASARRSAQEMGVRATFTDGDAGTPTDALRRSDLVVVNPPRRGLTPELTAALSEAGPATVIYSSCRAETLRRDLAAMPSYEVQAARLLDMFPQTTHHEVIVLLRRC